MKTLTSIICLASVLALSAGMANAELVAHWAFDETSGSTAFDSAYNHDGTIYGAGRTIGPDGGAMNFDGNNDYIDVADDTAFRFSQSSSFTIAFWAKPASNGYILTKMNASNQTGIFGYRVFWSGPLQSFGFAATSSNIGSSGVNTGTNSSVPGNWYHVAATYDNKNMKIYLDGVLRNTGMFAYNTGATTPDKNLAIGALSVENLIYAYFGGALDDTRIYNEALDADSIMQLYQTTPEPATMVLLGLGGLLLRRRIN